MKIFKSTSPLLNKITLFGNKEALQTLDEIRKLLILHCGPKAPTAVQCSRSVVQSPIYTKDGYNIIKSLEFNSSLAQWIQAEILYVGKQVEQYIGDGTTTAMLLAIDLLKLFWSNKHFKDITPKTLMDEFKNIPKLFKLLRPGKLNRNGPNYEQIKRLVTYQTLTSSHGREDFAYEVSNLFSLIPMEYLDNLSFIRSPTVTDKEIECIKDDHQYSFSVRAMHPSMLVGIDGGPLDIKDAAVITCGMYPIFNSPLWSKLRDTLNQIKDQKNVILIIPNQADMQSESGLFALGEEYSDKFKLHVFYVMNWNMHPTFNPITGFHAIREKPIDNGTFLITPHVSVSYTELHQQLNIDNIHEHAGMQREHATDNTTFIGKYLENLNKLIQQMENDRDEIRIRNAIEALRHLYLRVRYTTVYQLKLNGDVHTTTANTDVLIDVLKAVRSSLNHGFVPGCNFYYLAVLHVYETMQLRELWHYMSLTDLSKRTNEMLGTIYNTFNDIADRNLLDTEHPLQRYSQHIRQVFDKKYDSFIKPHRVGYGLTQSTDVEMPIIQLTSAWNDSKSDILCGVTDILNKAYLYMPIQPAELIPHTLKVIQNVILRMGSSTECILMP